MAPFLTDLYSLFGKRKAADGQESPAKKTKAEQQQHDPQQHHRHPGMHSTQPGRVLDASGDVPGSSARQAASPGAFAPAGQHALLEQQRHARPQLQEPQQHLQHPPARGRDPAGVQHTQHHQQQQQRGGPGRFAFGAHAQPRLQEESYRKVAQTLQQPPPGTAAAAAAAQRQARARALQKPRLHMGIPQPQGHTPTFFHRAASLTDGGGSSRPQSPQLLGFTPGSSAGPAGNRARGRASGQYGTLGRPPPQQQQQQRQFGAAHAAEVAAAQAAAAAAGRRGGAVNRTARPRVGGTSAAAAGGAAAGGGRQGLMLQPPNRAPAAAAGAWARPLPAAAAAAAAEQQRAGSQSPVPPKKLFFETFFEAQDQQQQQQQQRQGPAAAAAIAAAGAAATNQEAVAAAVAAAAAAGAGGWGAGTSTLTPPGGFNAALKDLQAQGQGRTAAAAAAAAAAADVGGSSVLQTLSKQEAGIQDRLAQATARLAKLQAQVKEGNQRAERLQQSIDRTLQPVYSAGYIPNPASAPALKELAALTREREQQQLRQLQQQQRERERQLASARETLRATTAAAATAVPGVPPIGRWQHKQQQEPESDEVLLVEDEEEQQQQQALQEDGLVIVSEEGASDQQRLLGQQASDAEAYSVGESSGEEEEDGSEEESEEESEQAAAAAVELGELGISTWLAPRANWSCSAEQLKRFRDVTQRNGQGVAATHERASLELTYGDLSTMREGQWLNDECMNMYMALLQDRDAVERVSGGLSCYFCNTFFFSKLYAYTQQYCYKNVRRWTLPARLKASGLSVDCVLKCDRVIVPVHEGNHWTALMVDIKGQRLVFFDSLLGQNRIAVEQVKRWLVDEAKDKLKADWDVSGWQEVFPHAIPQQRNGYDCGVFALMFCNRLSLKGAAFDFRQEDIGSNIRAAITNDMLGGKIALTGRRGS